jgi:hypothetical protein
MSAIPMALVVVSTATRRRRFGNTIPLIRASQVVLAAANDRPT